MASCEMCGSERPLLPTFIEGTTLQVCQTCASFGKVLPQPLSQPSVAPRSRLPESDEVLVDDFARLIKEAREGKTLDQKTLAQLVKEKESVIHKVESGHMRPPLDLARKLEKVLHLTLVQTYTSPGKLKSSADGTLTIGDLVKIRKRSR